MKNAPDLTFSLQRDVRTLKRILRQVVASYDTDDDAVFVEAMKTARRMLGVKPKDPRQDERDWAALQADTYKLPDVKAKLGS